MFLIVLLILQEDNNIIKVCHANNILKVRKCVVNIALECCWCVSKPKRHYLVFKVAIVYLKCSLLFIATLNVDVVVHILQV
jgi:hypothetical protein